MKYVFNIYLNNNIRNYENYTFSFKNYINRSSWSLKFYWDANMFPHISFFPLVRLILLAYDFFCHSMISFALLPYFNKLLIEFIYFFCFIHYDPKLFKLAISLFLYFTNILFSIMLRIYMHLSFSILS